MSLSKGDVDSESGVSETKVFCAVLFNLGVSLFRTLGGVVLCSDEFFSRDGHYCYNPALLGEAHEWNHSRGIVNLTLIVKSPYNVTWLMT